MASPAIVAKNTGNYSVGSLTSVTVTSAVANDGNVILAALAIIGAVSEPGLITAPVGWTPVQQNLAGSGSVTRVAVFSRIASGESGSYVFSWTNVSSIGLWIIAEYGGGDITLDGSANQQNALSVNSVAPSLTPSSWNSFDTLACFWAAEMSALNVMTLSAPAGMTLQAQSQFLSAGLPALMLANLALTSSAATGTETATAAFATTSIGISVLVKQSIWAGSTPSGGSST
jgi:hypothetical protein